ncbi:lantibiotic dehydratase [Chryseobacterium sp. SSA4.19]|uniref:lantibiotic dehydratase n=1 Tax=Chryseobacterium sp. SSA4.19 TaxID=2919915 RepID=UPI001F4E8853|nr:lantibiotic dehydratase [Chryseobacterium sp. SSA4.19]MCJ8152512.1 lantibiotic dehydratase [Chryseobacterium sp. SSA4.19]
MKYNDIERLNFYVLRVPLFSQKEINNWYDDINNEKFRKAIIISSPDLHEQISQLENNSLPKEKADKIRKSLLKYWLRMHYRTIPFGLNAGISKGNWDKQSSIILDNNLNKVNARLDMQLIYDIIRNLENKMFIREKIKYYSNNTLYATKNKYRYIEPSVKDSAMRYEITSTEKNKYLNSIVKSCIDGKTFNSIIDILVSKDIPYKDSYEYINELIDSKILISELSPKVTDKNFQDKIFSFLKNLDLSQNNHTDAQFILGLIEIFEIVKEINQKNDIESEINKISSILNKINIANHKKNIIQIDLLKGKSENVLSASIFKDFKKVLSIAFNIGAQEKVESLEEFKSVFIRRFDQQEIPLLFALDPLSGINYPIHSENEVHELIGNIQYKTENNNNIIKGSVEWNQFIGEKLIDAIKNYKKIINIDTNELSEFLHHNKNIPFSMSSIVQIYNDEANQPIIYHQFSDGPSSSTFTGRFCHLDEDLEESVKKSLQQEKEFYKDQIIAEIIHNPQPRVGNILLRPLLRDYEIPIITLHNSNSNPIYLSDLLISVKNDRIVLRSKKYNKEILPNLSSAHNYSLHKVPLYHFLCDLQYQNTSPSYSWNWGMFSNYDHLPRVAVHNVILSKESWLLSKDKIYKESPASVIDLKKYLLEKKIPNTFTFKDNDMELPVFLENELSLEILQDHIIKADKIRIFENLSSQYESIVKDTDGKIYSNEFIIPWHNLSSIQISAIKSDEVKNNVIRNYIPGSEWLYYKVHCSYQVSDQILKDTISKFASKLIKKGIIRKWFFIRYMDPDYHLRIRFLLNNNDNNIAHQLYQLLDKYLKDELIIHNISLDTYNREIERYGEATIDLMESIFYYDSECVCNLLKTAAITETSIWKFAVSGIDRILDDFGYNIYDKKNIMNRLSDGYSMRLDDHSKKSLKERYREQRNTILSLLIDLHNTYIFDKRTKMTKSAISDIKIIQSQNKVDSLVISYIHMFINRMFAAKPNLYESILYFFLHKSYDSLINIKKVAHD